MNIVITTLLNNITDPQRGNKWAINDNTYIKLYHSCKVFKNDLLILSDCLKEKNSKGLQILKTNSVINPYFQRWVSIREHLQHKEYNKIFCVDATDVEMLRNPFKEIVDNKIYVGYELSKVNNTWITDNHKGEFVDELIHCYGDKQLFNAGVIGGSIEILTDFLDKFIYLYEETQEDYQLTDMALFNFVLYKFFTDKVVSGETVTTRFKKNERNNISYFKHK